MSERVTVVPAPYVITGYFVADNVPDRAGIIGDIDQQLGAIASLSPLSVPGVFAVRATSANLHDRLDDITNLMVNLNQAHGDVVRWFAQLCDEPWFATE